MKTSSCHFYGKYTINMLMIVTFAALAFSGLFDGEGGHREGHRENFRDHSQMFIQDISAGEVRESVTGSLPLTDQPGTKEIELNFHAVSGLVWISLMLFHIFQHGAWFKKMISIRHMLRNKLLSITVLVFIILALSGICLAFNLIPGGSFNPKEIHEVSGQLLGILVIIHLIQRYKWIVATTKKVFVKKDAVVSPV